MALREVSSIAFALCVVLGRYMFAIWYECDWFSFFTNGGCFHEYVAPVPSNCGFVDLLSHCVLVVSTSDFICLLG